MGAAVPYIAIMHDGIIPLEILISIQNAAAVGHGCTLQKIMPLLLFLVSESLPFTFRYVFGETICSKIITSSSSNLAK